MRKHVRIAVFMFTACCSVAYAEEDRCTRATCFGEARIFSSEEEPAIACETSAICEYVATYQAFSYLVSVGDADEGDAEDRAFLQRLMEKAGLSSFSDADGRFTVRKNGERVTIQSADFRSQTAYVLAKDGREFWMVFDNLIPAPKTAKNFPNDRGVSTAGSQIVASLVNAGAGIYNVRFERSDSSTPVPKSYDEHITFSLEDVAPKGGQIFICTQKRYCDAIYSYFDALKGLAGPYVYRARSGKVVMQLNNGLHFSRAEEIKNALGVIREK